MIKKQEIKRTIEKLGLSGKEVCVHTSMKSFGCEIEGGIGGLADCFLDLGCTILVPTFSHDFEIQAPGDWRIEGNGYQEEDYRNKFHHQDGKIFTPESRSITVESMGIFNEYVLNHPESRRGNHPLNSFTALGKNARKLVKDQSPEQVYAPFRQLYQDGGFVLLIGVNLDRATVIHYAEQLAGRRPFIRWAYDPQGNPIPAAIGSCSRGFGNLEHIGKKLEVRQNVGNSCWRCFPIKELTDTCARAVREDPMITHCDDEQCQRCNDAALGGPSFFPNSFFGQEDEPF